MTRLQIYNSSSPKACRWVCRIHILCPIACIDQSSTQWFFSPLQHQKAVARCKFLLLFQVPPPWSDGGTVTSKPSMFGSKAARQETERSQTEPLKRVQNPS